MKFCSLELLKSCFPVANCPLDNFLKFHDAFAKKCVSKERNGELAYYDTNLYFFVPGNELTN